MIRGTTPTHVFRLPIATDTIKALRITYAQMGCTVLDKTENDVHMDGNTVTLTLTQEDTLRFDTAYPVYWQMKVLTHAGTLLACQVKRLTVGDILNDEVLT